jgi:Fe-S cluster biosynthesis and repair protein YggX
MSDKEERKTKEEKIEPFVVPEDWEPTSEKVKKIRELTSWIPKELGKKWWDEIQEEHRKGRDSEWMVERGQLKDNIMSGEKKGKTEEKIEPFVVPEDWESTDGVVKKIRELTSWIPKELGKKWWDEIQEERRKRK